MTNLKLPLPEPLLAYAAEQAVKNGLATLGEYLLVLLDEDRCRVNREALENKLSAGIYSGPSLPMTAANWDSLKQRVAARVA